MPTRGARGAVLLIQKPIRALRRHIPAAVAGEDRGVHQARVASRRLRELLPVLGAGDGAPHTRKASRTVRKLTRALGSVRELDVSVALIDELATSDDLSRQALQDVRLHVTAERERRREKMLRRLGRIDLARLDHKLAKIAGAIGTSTTWRDALGARIGKRSRDLSEAIDEAGQLYAPEQLHRVRIAAKKLRYALELAADSGVRSAAPLVRKLKRVQETLGTLHDLQVLQSHVVEAQLAAPDRAPIHEGLAALAGRVEERCRVLHGRYIKGVPDLRELTGLATSTVAPQLLGARRPLKMGLRSTRAVARTAR